MKSKCYGALKPDRLGLSCKANNCSDAGTVDPGVPTTDGAAPWFPLVMPAQPARVNAVLSTSKVGFHRDV